MRKPNGKVRICLDFKKINSVTRPMTFYTPKIEEVIEAVGKACVVSKMDLSKGYYQVRMAEEDIPKTAFVCQRGKFEFLRMPFCQERTGSVPDFDGFGVGRVRIVCSCLHG